MHSERTNLNHLQYCHSLLKEATAIKFCLGHLLMTPFIIMHAFLPFPIHYLHWLIFPSPAHVKHTALGANSRFLKSALKCVRCKGVRHYLDMFNKQAPFWTIEGDLLYLEMNGNCCFWMKWMNGLGEHTRICWLTDGDACCLFSL